MVKYIPNTLTVFRMILVPVFIYFAFFIDGMISEVFSLLVFGVASITDLFDGLIARKFNVVTNFGKIMDPLADKFLVVAAMAVGVFKYKEIPLIVFIIVILREVIVTVLREYYSKKKIVIPANVWGKLKTVTQMIGLVIILTFHSALHIFPVQSWVDVYKNFVLIVFWLIAVITVLSGVSYFRRKK